MLPKPNYSLFRWWIQARNLTTPGENPGVGSEEDDEENLVVDEEDDEVDAGEIMRSYLG